MKLHLPLFLILLLAALFRFHGIDWDRGYLFHPDERQIVLVASRLDLPKSLGEFFSPSSPLNPHFFAYGSLPIYLLRILASFAPSGLTTPYRDASLVGMVLVGRVASGIFDLGTIVLIALIGRRLYDARVGLIAAAGTAITVLHIQLAHFYAVDTQLTFLILLTIYFSVRYAQTARRADFVTMWLAFGAAMATKVSALPVIVPMVVALLEGGGHWGVSPRPSPPSPAGRASVPEVEDPRSAAEGAERSGRAGGEGIWFLVREYCRILKQPLARGLLVAGAVFFLTQPYALLAPLEFWRQVGQEIFAARGWLDFPYTRQYANTLPYIYQIWQSSVWGTSLPLGLWAWGGAMIFAVRWWRTRDWNDGFILSWAFVYFLAIGGQYVKYLRYLLPLLPFLYLMAARVISDFRFRISNFEFRITNFELRILNLSRYLLSALAFLSALLYSLAFSTIYDREHPWITISRDLYQNLPRDSVLAVEHWDDALPQPILLNDTTRQVTEYHYLTMPMYDPDDAVKLNTLSQNLARADYVILSTQRLYATIPRLPDRYPLSTRYYTKLFDGELGYELIAHARDDPRLGNLVIVDDPFADLPFRAPARIFEFPSDVIVWNWGKADESFVVYDHPVPLVFKNARRLDEEQIQAILQGD